MSLNHYEAIETMNRVKDALTSGPQQRQAMHALRLVSGPAYLIVPHTPPG